MSSFPERLLRTLPPMHPFRLCSVKILRENPCMSAKALIWRMLIFTFFPNSYVGGSNFASAEITIGNVSAPFQVGGGFTPAFGGLSSSVFTKGPDNIQLENGGLT